MSSLKVYGRKQKTTNSSRIQEVYVRRRKIPKPLKEEEERQQFGWAPETPEKLPTGRPLRQDIGRSESDMKLVVQGTAWDDQTPATPIVETAAFEAPASLGEGNKGFDGSAGVVLYSAGPTDLNRGVVDGDSHIYSRGRELDFGLSGGVDDLQDDAPTNASGYCNFQDVLFSAPTETRAEEQVMKCAGIQSLGFAFCTHNEVSNGWDEGMPFTQLLNMSGSKLLQSSGTGEDVTQFDMSHEVLDHENDERCSQYSSHQAAPAVPTPPPRNQSVDLKKRQNMKTKRKKHRPKVVVDGTQKRTPKPSTPKPATPRKTKEKTPGKRKCTRKSKQPELDSESRSSACTNAMHAYTEKIISCDKCSSNGVTKEIVSSQARTRKSCKRVLDFNSASELVGENVEKKLALSLVPIGCEYNSLQKYQKLWREQLNFPKLCKKMRSKRRRKLNLFLWSDYTFVTIYKWCNVDGTCTRSRRSKRKLVIKFTPSKAQNENADTGTSGVNLGEHAVPLEGSKAHHMVLCPLRTQNSCSLGTQTSEKESFEATCFENLSDFVSVENVGAKAAHSSIEKESAKFPLELEGHGSKNEPILKEVESRPTTTLKGSTEVVREAAMCIIIEKLQSLCIKDGGEQVMKKACRGKAKKSHQSKEGALVPYQGSSSLVVKKSTAKVDLDPETLRVWNLLKDAGCKEQVGAEKEEQWQKERDIFKLRIDTFNARNFLIQGDRGFRKWKGSVVDSVVGVFLTQNVTDHVSSSAFMSLAATFSIKKTCTSDAFNDGREFPSSQESVGSNMPDLSTHDWEGDQYFVCEPDLETSQELEKRIETLASRIPESKSLQIEDVTGSDGSTDMGGSSLSIPISTAKEHLEFFKDSSNSVANSSVPCWCREEEEEEEEEEEAEMNHSCCLHQEQTSNSRSSTKPMDDQEGKILNTETQLSIDSTVTKKRKRRKQPEGEHDSLDKDGKAPRKGKIKGVKKKREDIFWENLRKEYSDAGPRSADQMDSVDWEAVRAASVDDVANSIQDRGQQFQIAIRIKDFLDRLVRIHGNINLEWLRNVPPDLTKEYLLEVNGLGLKSVECVRLLSLKQVAFPVDTNVGRIAVRLGWVPLQPLPEALEIHLLEQYPLMDSIQKYLWPRLCTLDQKTLYELHYQMITFGKVFCTKRNPNCNACPMRGECRHFASAFASARLCLPGPTDKRVVTIASSAFSADYPSGASNYRTPLSLGSRPCAECRCQTESCEFTIEDPFALASQRCSGCRYQTKNSEPIVEEPVELPFREPEIKVIIVEEPEIEYDPEGIPIIKLNVERFQTNLLSYMDKNGMMVQGGETSRGLVSLTPEEASIPVSKLKSVSRLRTEHQVYELPENHYLLRELQLDELDPDDPLRYHLAIWQPGETVHSLDPPKKRCNSSESELCNDQTCFSCNCIREQDANVVRATILIPSRTANRGSFPLNGTYFQVNEVFADHETSHNPIVVPRDMIYNLRRRTAYFGTSISSILKGLPTREIQKCFWKGVVCVRAFERAQQCPRPLVMRFHCSPSKMESKRGKQKDKLGNMSKGSL